MPKKKKKQNHSYLQYLLGAIILLGITLLFVLYAHKPPSESAKNTLPKNTAQLETLAENLIFQAAQDYQKRKTSVGNPSFVTKLTKEENPEFDNLLKSLSDAAKAQSLAIMKQQMAPSGEYGFIGYLTNERKFPLLTVEGVIVAEENGPKLYGLSTQSTGETLTELDIDNQKWVEKMIQDFLNLYAEDPAQAVKKYADETLFTAERLQPIGPLIKQSQKDIQCEVFYGDTQTYQALKEIVPGLNRKVKGYGAKCVSGNITSKYTLIQNKGKRKIVGLRVQ